MNIPQGYKHTEFGLIPNDWVLCVFKDVLTTFSSGATPYRGIPEYYTGNIRWISSRELNYNVIYDTLEHISANAVRSANLHVHNPGTFLMAITGLEAEGTRGKCAFVGASATTNQSCLAINGSDRMCVEYLFWFYRMWGDYLAFKYCQGTKQQSYTAHIVRMLPIYCPTTIEEQNKIAEALSDVDALIAALDKKIAKKRLVKQGAMQQLLSGKKRLQGFTNEWVDIEFGHYVDVYRGGSPRPIEQFLTSNTDGVNWIKIGDVLPEDKYINSTTEKIIKKGVQFSREVFAGDFILSNSMSFGRPYILNINGCIHDGWLVIQNYNSTFDIDFLYYILCSDNVMKQYIAMAAGSSVKNLNKEKVAALQLYIPANIEEQHAIAMILSEMDKEIADLEARRDKYKLIKTGMMQKLLTGQIRLVKPLAPVVSLEIPDAKVREIPLQTHVIAGHIVNMLYQASGCGRTKLQKTLHLVGYHCQLDFGNEYIRNTAGPDDQAMMNHIDGKFKQYRHVKIEAKKENGKTRYNYVPTAMIDELEQVYETYPQTIRSAVDSLINKLKTMDLARAEIVSTLYAVWNNRIIKGEPISDDLLLDDFYAWSKHKSDFSRDLVLWGLNYMRREGIIPIGWGKYIDKK